MEENNPNLFERINQWISDSATIKLISIGFLILILLIPASMISGLIREREITRNEVMNEVSDKWSREQTLCGPILTIPYKKYEKDAKGDLIETTAYSHFLPNQLKINGDVLSEVRYRSIYKVVVYNTQLNFSGNFDLPEFKEWNIADTDILWDDAFVSVGIPDMRGINENINLEWDGSNMVFNPGLQTNDFVTHRVVNTYQVAPQIESASKAINSSGISTPVPFSDRTKTAYSFLFNLDLNGSRFLNFIPLGKETTLNLKSDWSNPSFDGAFLPDNRTVTDSGFVASWKVLHLNRNYPQQWLGAQYQVGDSEFGINLPVPVDEYQKNMRSAKYAAMIIAFTFLMFFFVEILNKKRIHPFQYILVGLALCIFYTLLLSLSEHISFNMAYAISCIVIISMIVLYAKTIFKSQLLTGILAGMLLVVYGFIFVILQLQDLALLIGSIGLVIVLGVLMYLSRNIDWYNFKKVPDIKQAGI